MRKMIRILVLLAVFAIPLSLGVMWLDHLRETKLPQPTGPFAVGRVTYDWIDAAHTDPYFGGITEPPTKRELLVWIWYPAAPTQSSHASSDYLPPPWRSAVEHQRGTLLTQFLTRDLSRVRTHSTSDAQLSAQEPSYPVVVMRGGHSGLVTGYTSLAEDLASHGYVVVGFDAPYRSSVVVFPDGRIIERAPESNLDALSGLEQEQRALELVHAWSADIGFALDQLERLNGPSGKFQGRLDLRRVGVFGHSLGGATALQFCHDDSRCKAGIDVDGRPLGNAIAEGVTQPFMFLLSDHSGNPDSEARLIMANIRSIYDHQPADRRLEIAIRGANHYMFSDDGATLKSPLLMSVLRILGIVRIDGRRQIAVSAHYIVTFFDVYLKGAPASELQSQPEYPEVEYIR
jgi:dienelactone hydrolase